MPDAALLQSGFQHTFDVLLPHHLIPVNRAGALIDGAHSEAPEACRTENIERARERLYWGVGSVLTASV
ncbi:hypothetical protein GCM10017783_10630 [Deinococcus piscis]|uniref:Uncharacterized protein n=1 Tax=Deinococcus piscis TaxID=394230 RepID=A0ABQ3K253_9DEIO|nr:hypothetical protein GCM10017783_10630 [Deinococcus piscis]